MGDAIEREQETARTGNMFADARPPSSPKRNKPKRQLRLTNLTAFAAGFVAAILAISLAGRGGQADVAEIVPEHGDFTKAVLVDRGGLNYPLHIAIDPPNLDSDEIWAPEHGPFTDPYVLERGDREYSGFVGTDPPNLDPD